MPRGFIRWEAPALLPRSLCAPCGIKFLVLSIGEERDLADWVDFPGAARPVALRANGAGQVVAIEEERAFNYDANRSDKGLVLTWRLTVEMVLERIANLLDRILIRGFVRDTADFNVDAG